MDNAFIVLEINWFDGRPISLLAFGKSEDNYTRVYGGDV
jgi:hypothetical protein